jgi:hypothetical protein
MSFGLIALSGLRPSAAMTPFMEASATVASV